MNNFNFNFNFASNFLSAGDVFVQPFVTFCRPDNAQDRDFFLPFPAQSHMRLRLDLTPNANGRGWLFMAKDSTKPILQLDYAGRNLSINLSIQTLLFSNTSPSAISAITMFQNLSTCILDTLPICQPFCVKCGRMGIALMGDCHLRSGGSSGLSIHTSACKTCMHTSHLYNPTERVYNRYFSAQLSGNQQDDTAAISKAFGQVTAVFDAAYGYMDYTR